MLEIIAGWDQAYQIGMAAFLLLMIYLFLVVLVNNLRIIIQGYPPGEDPDTEEEEDEEEEEEEEEEERSSCEHVDNLTGECLKEGADCVTRQECEYEISKRKPMPMVHDEAKKE